MKVENDGSCTQIEFHGESEQKAFKRILHHAQEDFKNFPNLHLFPRLLEDYKFMQQLLTLISNI